MLSRRRFLTIGTGLAAASLTGCTGLSGRTGRRTLRDIVGNRRTFDVEVHLNDTELYTGTELPDLIDPSPERIDRGMKMFGEPGATGYADNLVRYRDYLSRTSMELKAEFLFDDLDGAGIHSAVHQVVDHSFKASTIGRHYRAGFERMLEDAARIRQNYPGRLITMVGIDPRSGRANAVRQFETAVRDYGCSGLGEVVLQQFETYPHDPVMYALYEKCIEFNLPFSGNCEGPSRYTLPREYEQVAKDLPELRILLAGAGRPRNPSQSREPVWDAVRLANEYENVYLDTADWMRRDREGIELYMAFLRRCFDSNAGSKVMYASDFPVLTSMYSTRDWVDVLINQAGDYGYNFSDEEITRYFSSNALTFLGSVL
ncbi:MAG: amidohydrolase family protein [Pseudomonadota bacterium]